GGITPGQSTDAVAAVMAEILESDLLVRATDLDGVYTANPDTDPEATLLPEVSMKQLLQLIGKGRQSAGEYPLLDQVAANILQRSQIPTIFINGKKTHLITQAALTKKVEVGTLITHTKK
ncbi:MAG: amino acid kinase family protein, partial [Candidatus Ranarchaeia archaeon]